MSLAQQHPEPKDADSALMAELRAASSRYRLCEPLEEGVLVLDSDACILYLNPSAARMLGKPREELFGAVLWPPLLEWAGTAWETELRAARDAGETRNFRAFCPSSRTWIQARVEPIDDGLCVYLRDVQAEHPVADAVEEIDDAYVLLDRNGVYQYVNRQATRLIGRAADELVGRNMWELYPEARKGPVFGAIGRVFEERQPVHLEADSAIMGRFLAVSLYPQGDYVAIFTRDITDRKRSEARLRESEREFRALFELSAVGKAQVDPRTYRFLRVNRKFCEITGYSADELREMTFSDITHPEDRAKDIEGYQAALSGTQETWTTTKRYVHRDGHIVWIQLDGTILRDEQGNPFRTMASVLDVTERRQAEEALRYRGEQFETLLNQAPLAIYLLDADFRVVEANPLIRTALARLPGGIIGREFEEISRLLWKPEFADRIVRVFRHTLETGVPYYAAEEEAFAPDGTSTGCFEWRIDRITLPDGRYGLVCYSRNITAQVEARHALEESENLFRTLGEAVPLHLWMADAEGRPLYQNPAWHEYTGLTSEEYAATGWEVLHHPEDLPHLRALWEEALRSGAPLESEVRIRRHDGVYRWFACRAVPIQDAQGRVVKWVGTHLDVDRQKRAEVALAESARSLTRERERLAIALRAGEMGVYEWRVGDPDVWWSPETYPVYGVTPATFTPTMEAFAALIHPDDRDEVWRKTQESLATGDVFMHEYRVVRPDGAVCWVYNRSHVRMNAEGRAERITGVAMDITERKRAEQALRESEEFTRRITDVAPSILYVYDLETHSNLWGNREMTALLGYTAEQIDAMAGRLMQTLLHPEDWERYQTHFAGLLSLADGEAAEFEYRMRTVEGDWRWLHSRDMIFRRTADGRPRQIVGAAMDITARKEAEEALRQEAQKNERIAETLQRSLLIAPDPARLPGIEIGTEYQAALEEALIGGDFFDAFSLGDSRIALVVGDATGKGLKAAEHIAEIKYALRAFLRENPDPAEALNRLNRFACASQNLDAAPSADRSDESAFVAVAAVVLEVPTGAAVCAAAGMEPPLVLHPDHRPASEISVRGTLIGATPGATYTPTQFVLAAGDLLVLATDGITEARQGGAFFGTEGLANAVREAAQGPTPLPEAARNVVARAVAFARGKRHDDMCLLLARRTQDRDKDG
jgi:PAS domain S-box-containing protein